MISFEEKREITGYITRIVTSIIPEMILPLTFLISIYVGNIIKFGEVIELMALVGRIRWPMECIKNMQRKIVSIKIDMLRTEEFLS
jgi:hypothetical protein